MGVQIKISLGGIYPVAVLTTRIRDSTGGMGFRCAAVLGGNNPKRFLGEMCYDLAFDKTSCSES